MFKTYYIQHNGCEPIWFESEKIRVFNADNFGLEPSEKENADVIVLTICTFTEQKEKESINLINDCLRSNVKKIIVTGCFLKKYVENDRVLYLNYGELTEYFKANFKLNDRKHIFSIAYDLDEIVAVSRGCYGRCSYCSIKLAKGKHVSRPVEDIICDIEKRRHHSYIKIVGDDLAGFGKDTGTNLFKLISEIHKEFPSIGIKFGSLNVKHLKEFNEEEIAMFANPYIQGNIHVPVQSSSDRILKLMLRDYNINEYERIYNKLCKLGVKNISTDIISGFPGESEEDHKLNLEFISIHDFNFVEFFMYQEREGTKAAKMKQLPERIRRKRTIEAIGIFINSYIDKRKVPLEEVNTLEIFNTNIKESWKQ